MSGSHLAIESARVLVLQEELYESRLKQAACDEHLGRSPIASLKVGPHHQSSLCVFAVTHRGSAARQCMHRLQTFAAHGKQKES